MCNEPTLEQPALLHSYTPYTLCTGALAYIPTLHESTNTQPYTTLQTYYTLHTYPTPTYLPYGHTLPLQTYTTQHTYPTPTYLHYPYNPHNTTHPKPYTAYWPFPCTPAQ